MSCTRSLLKTTLLWGSLRARLHQLANALRQLPIDDANHRGGFASDHSAELGGTWHFYESNPPGIEKRDHLVEAVTRRVHRDDRVRHLVLLRAFAHLLHSDHRSSSAHSEADEPQQPAMHLGTERHSAPPRLPVCTSPSAGASSVVSSSRSEMMRSASSGAMPARRRKSSRSRSMMSFSVRYPASLSTATVAGCIPASSVSGTSAASSLSASPGSGAKSCSPPPFSSHSRLE